MKGEITTTIAVLSGLLITAALVLSNMLGQLQALKDPSSSLALGSVSVTNEYLSTTTSATAVYGNLNTGDTVVKKGRGTLGSLVITGANTGIVAIYNATTTSVKLRAANRATTSILIAEIPASMAAGTYVFDVEFTDGLLFDLISGVMPTTTVTYR